MADASGFRVRGRPRLGWMESVKVALGSRGMMVEVEQKKIGRSGEPWCICRCLSSTRPFLRFSSVLSRFFFYVVPVEPRNQERGNRISTRRGVRYGQALL